MVPEFWASMMESPGKQDVTQPTAIKSQLIEYVEIVFNNLARSAWRAVWPSVKVVQLSVVLFLEQSIATSL